MTRSKKNHLLGRADRLLAKLVLLWLVVAVIALSASLFGGCASQQPEAAWPPDVAFHEASIKGSVELATPAGPVTVDLSTGIVDGDGEVELVRVDLEAQAAFEVNGLVQGVQIVSPGSPGPEGDWAQCVSFAGLAEVMPNVALVIKAKPPGLPASCGEPSFEVSTSVRDWSTSPTHAGASATAESPPDEPVSVPLGD